MARSYTFAMAGGGTGGHVVPSLAVAAELRARGHEVFFIGTRAGFEARLVPERGFPIEWIEIGGLKRVGWRAAFRTLASLPGQVLRSRAILARRAASAVFSMGGYVAGPVMIAAWLRRLPMVLMEPNAMPGLTNRWMGRIADRALISFPEAARHFRRGRAELTGLPVRREFFEVLSKPPGEEFVVLITGGSRGSRTLNQAVRGAWPLLRDSGLKVRLVHQCGAEAHAELEAGFRQTGLEGEVTPFLDDMPRAYAGADLVVSRSGAGAVAEIAAAGKPAILAPFPYAADDHQLANARSMERIGAARVVLDRECDGQRLFGEIAALARDREAVLRMGQAARQVARPGAAERAADLLEELAANRRERG